MMKTSFNTFSSRRVFQQGQALVSLLVFVAIATVITSASVAVTIINTQSAGTFSLGEEAYQLAEAGAENAVLQLLRNTSYVGETLSLGSGTVTITVTGTTTKTIDAESTVGNFHRKVQVTGAYSGTVFTVNTWQEI